jgi:hypothetical protein
VLCSVCCMFQFIILIRSKVFCVPDRFLESFKEKLEQCSNLPYMRLYQSVQHTITPEFDYSVEKAYKRNRKQKLTFLENILCLTQRKGAFVLFRCN